MVKEMGLGAYWQSAKCYKNSSDCKTCQRALSGASALSTMRTINSSAFS